MTTSSRSTYSSRDLALVAYLATRKEIKFTRLEELTPGTSDYTFIFSDPNNICPKIETAFYMEDPSVFVSPRSYSDGLKKIKGLILAKRQRK